MKKGKRSLPYLLSTTKSLTRCDQYYYTSYDFKFKSKKNREYESEKHCLTNLTRMWHNVIIPNAIICLRYGKPATLKDAFTALNYAMTTGKAGTAIDAYKAVIATENAKPEEDRIWTTLKRSFYFYGLGEASNNDGLLYALPKSKRVDLDTYIKRIAKYKRSLGRLWVCSCSELNKLIYAWVHWEDAWREREDYRTEKEDRIKVNAMFFNREDQIQQIAAERDADKCPQFPSTYEDIRKQFGSSYATISKFKKWLKQFHMTDSDALWSHQPQWAALYDKKTRKSIEAKAVEYLDSNEYDDDGNLIYKIADSVQNSGQRPVGRVDDSDYFSF